MAYRVLSLGHPTRKEDAAYVTLQSCPRESALVFADAFTALRRSTDLAQLEWLTTAGARWQDQTVFDAADAVARDPGASPEARVYALIGMERLIHARTYHPYSGVLAEAAAPPPPAGRGRACAEIFIHSLPQLPGATPLGPDAMDRLRATTRRLLEDPSAPALVRTAARCISP